jgi:biotin operon repressor
MSQIDKIATVLAQNTKTPGLTTAMIAKKAGVPKQNVAKRVSDLRREGFEIYTNFRVRNGERKTYYRMAS